MRYLVLLACGLLVFGCKGKPAIVLKNPGAPTLSSGWVMATSRDGSVSIAMASGWGKSIPGLMPSPTEQLGADAPAGGGGADPQMQQLSQQLDKMNAEQDAKEAERLESKGILITAYAQGVRPVVGEEVTRYYVTKKHQSGNATMEDAIEPFSDSSGRPRAPEKVTLPIGDASLFAIVHNLRDGGVVHEWTYVIPSKEDIYSVTFITENDPSSIDQIRTDVMKTLRVKG